MTGGIGLKRSLTDSRLNGGYAKMQRSVFIAAVILLVLYIIALGLDAIPVHQTGLDLAISSHRLFAWLGLAFLLIQFILSARIKSWEINYSLDRRLADHRRFGQIGVTFLFLHVALILTQDITGAGFILTTPRIWGIAAFVLVMTAGAMASLHKRLGVRYETWKSVHLLTYLGFPLALLHVWPVGPTGQWYWMGLGATLGFFVLLVHRGVSIYQLRRQPYEVVDVQRENADTWTLSFSGKRVHYNPGQFGHFQLIREGRRSASHPFTLASSPTESKIRITPKESGDFTKTIGDTRIGDRAYIDAPFGSFTYHQASRHLLLVFIAGGIGITPFMSMLRHMKAQGIDRPVRLFWANKHERNLLFDEELAEMEAHFSDFRIIHFMSEQPDWMGESGHIHITRIQPYLPSMDCEYFLCGPPPMTRALESQLREMRIPRQRIHREIFEL